MWRKKHLDMCMIVSILVLSAVSVNGWVEYEESSLICEEMPLSSFTDHIFDETTIFDLLNLPFDTQTTYPTIKSNITIEGIVRDNTTNMPLKDAQVFCYYAYDQTYDIDLIETRTNADGFYTLHLPTIHSGVVIARYPLYYSGLYQLYSSMPEHIYAHFRLSTGQLPETSTLKGFIRDNITLEPVGDATLFVYWANDKKDIDFNYTITDNNGYFEMDVKYGKTGFIVIADEYLPFMQQGFLWFDWAETKWINISIQPLPKLSTICGYIYDTETGNRVEDATVLVKWTNDIYRDNHNISTTDTEGFYTVKVQRGSGSIHITHKDYYYNTENYPYIIEYEVYWANFSIEPVVPTDPYKTYRYNWTKHIETLIIGDALYAGKNTPYDATITIQGNHGVVITNADVQLNWEDDITYGIIRKKGLDRLTATIQYGSAIQSDSSIGNGNHSFLFNINDRLKDGEIEAESFQDALDILDELIKGKNVASFDVTVTVETGERLLRVWKFLKDEGNIFELMVTYTFYSYDLQEVNN